MRRPRVVACVIGLVGATLVAASVAMSAGPTGSRDPEARLGPAPMRDDRYANLGPFELPTWPDLADWYWHWWRDGGAQPPPGGYAGIPVRRPDLACPNANRRDTAVTWIGHATVLLRLARVNVLTDPMFSDRAFFVDFMGPDRKVRVPLTIAGGLASTSC